MSQNSLETYTKTDISYNHGYKLFRNSFIRQLIVHIIQIVILTTFLPIDATLLTPGNKIIPAISIALAASIISSIILSLQYHYLFRKQGILGYLQLARQTLHLTIQPITDPSSEDSCTSQITLDAETSTPIAGVQQKAVEIYANITQRQICQTCEIKYPSLNCLVRIDYLTGLSSILIVIVLMANSDQLNPPEIAVLICYLVLQAYSRFSVIIILLFIAISPLVCLGVTLYFCFCGQSQSNIILQLQPTKANRQHILLSDGQCTICLMNIDIGDDIYVNLPCSQKHIFHTGCLDKWSKVKMTCPTCRKQLPFHNDSNPPDRVQQPPPQ